MEQIHVNSKIVFHEIADLEFDALVNEKPVKGVSDEGRAVRLAALTTA